jgi:hypothetical protein
MNAYQLRNGNLVIPIRAESDGVLGDALVVIGSAHPDYEKWLRFVQPAPADIEGEFGGQSAWDGQAPP